VFGEVLRVIAALLVAATASATVFVAADLVLLPLSPDEADPAGFILQTVAFLWPVTFTVAFAHALVLGLPAYLLLRWRRLTAWWTSLIGGFVVGSLPYAVFALPWGAPPEPSLVAAHIIPRFTWLHYAGAVGGLGALGMAGGIAAWLTWYWLGRIFGRPQTTAPG
jgi:hypothetical protein